MIKALTEWEIIVQEGFDGISNCTRSKLVFDLMSPGFI